jgi:hypothetical protein
MKKEERLKMLSTMITKEMVLNMPKDLQEKLRDNAKAVENSDVQDIVSSYQKRRFAQMGLYDDDISDWLKGQS